MEKFRSGSAGPGEKEKEQGKYEAANEGRQAKKERYSGFTRGMAKMFEKSNRCRF